MVKSPHTLLGLHILFSAINLEPSSVAIVSAKLMIRRAFKRHSLEVLRSRWHMCELVRVSLRLHCEILCT